VDGEAVPPLAAVLEDDGDGGAGNVSYEQQASTSRKLTR
jgi:hypothetical protein